MNNFANNAFFGDGRRFCKGNLHCPSTTPDGSRPYERLAGDDGEIAWTNALTPGGDR